MQLERTPPASTPSFGLLVRFWFFVQKVYVRRTPWRVSDAADELEISERTIRRYVDIALTLLTDGDGEALIAIQLIEGHSYVVLRKFLLPFEALVRRPN
jgi:predicted DNA-binding transcriptional regulator YafY